MARRQNVGSKRRVAIWYIRNKGEYVVIPPHKPKNIDYIFCNQRDMLEFARASHFVLKERVQNVRNNHDRGGLRRMDMDRL